MQEVTSKRSKNSKTFKKNDGTYQKKVYPHPIHYQDENGTWNEISAKPELHGGIAQFNDLPFDVEIDRESWCGELTFSGDGFEITTHLSPVYNNTNKSINDVLSCSYDETSSECCLKQRVAEGSEHQYRVNDNGYVKIENKITTRDALPESFVFVISYEGVKPEYSDVTRTVKTIDKTGEKETTTKEETPRFIKFVNESGETVWRFDDATYLRPDGEAYGKPFNIERMGGGKIVGSFDLPTIGWAVEAIEQGELVLDPSYSTSPSWYSDTDEFTHTTDGPITNIRNEQLTVVGIEREEEQTTHDTLRDREEISMFEDDLQAPFDITHVLGDRDKLPDDIDAITSLWVENDISIPNDLSSDDAPAKTWGYRRTDRDVVDYNLEYGETVGEYPTGDWDTANRSRFNEVLSFDGDIHPEDLGTTEHFYDVDDDGVDTEYGYNVRSTTDVTYAITEMVTLESSDISIEDSGISGVTLGEDETETASISVRSGDNSFSISVSGSSELRLGMSYDADYAPPDPPSSASATVEGV